MALGLMGPDLHVDGNTKAGTAGGTLLILFVNLHGPEVIKTILLAAIGATVSFTVSMLLKILVKKFRRK